MTTPPTGTGTRWRRRRGRRRRMIDVSSSLLLLLVLSLSPSPARGAYRHSRRHLFPSTDEYDYVLFEPVPPDAEVTAANPPDDEAGGGDVGDESTAEAASPRDDEVGEEEEEDSDLWSYGDGVWRRPVGSAAPYGGYARATASRLAKVPLRLVGGARFDELIRTEENEEEDEGKKEGDDAKAAAGDEMEADAMDGSKLEGGEEAEEGTGTGDGGGEDEARDKDGKEDGEGEEPAPAPLEHYFNVRDARGRLFACRVYDEDDLLPRSVRESVFDEALEVADFSEEAEAAELDAANLMDGETFHGEPKPWTQEDQWKQVKLAAREMLREDSGNAGGGKTTGSTGAAAAATATADAGGGGAAAAGGASASASASASGASSSSSSSTSAAAGAAAASSTPEDGGDLDDGEVMEISVDADDVARVLKQMEGVCAQIHRGYWSYEWCFQTHMKQFHIAAVRKHGAAGRTKVRSSGGGGAGGTDDATAGPGAAAGAAGDLSLSVESVINLGKYISQSYQIKVGGGSAATPDDHFYSIQAQQVFEDGDHCEETGRPRRAVVDLVCCPVERDRRFFGEDGRDADGTPRVKMVEVKEHKSRVCEYDATVCSPVLCGQGLVTQAKVKDRQPEREMQERRRRQQMQGQGQGQGQRAQSVSHASSLSEAIAAASASSSDAVGKKREKESIRQILSRTIGGLCLQRGEGWWKYEFCHTRHARQFHAETVIDTVTEKVSVVIDGNYMLGHYDPTSVDYSEDREVEHVQNSRSTDAVYSQEYVGGDVCDDSDVADSAIKGGKVSDSGGIERATTVKFMCGKNLDLTRVDEDTSCHYVFYVTVPDLCQHPLFQAPVVKEQVIKCLPVEKETW